LRIELRKENPMKLLHSFSPIWLVSVLLLPALLPAQMTVSLDSSAGTYVPIGSVATWNATVSGTDSGSLSYRFRVRRNGGNFSTVVDYGPKPALDWTAIDGEGLYEIEVSVKNSATGEVVQNVAPAILTARVTPAGAVITPTSHPLVYLYSGPPCAAGSRIRVQFQAPGSPVQSTHSQMCQPNQNVNFYLAGMRAATNYSVQCVIETGRFKQLGPVMTLTTGSISVQAPQTSMVTVGSVPVSDGILLQSMLAGPAIATDLQGNVVWYSPSDITFLTRPTGDGTFLAIREDGTKDPSQQFFREFDLAGVTRAETNAARVNEQLAQLGVHPINGFHHEARKLPDGKYLVLADSERILTDVQGPGPVDVIGDTILVLDQDLQVVWTWDSFDHLDPSRAAILGETCALPPGLACAPWYLSPTANDWLHGNALQLVPDGNILYSARHQDWLIKIDYANGAGHGDILWRLGKDGDFQMASSDPNPWFSHQHDPGFLADDVQLMLFDNGNTRHMADPSIHSRGQILRIDEQNRVATLVMNTDIGGYSAAVGSAQRLPNGDYHFDAGFLFDPSTLGYYSQSLEVDKFGNQVYGIQFAAPEYRSFRMPDLYTAPLARAGLNDQAPLARH
jgi:arylsulfate sulfotransferase